MAFGKTQLPRAIVALGIASLLTDLSSEMIYPLLPVFLTAVLGASASALGLIEGVAESVASFMKLASGVWTDKTGKRKPLVVAGYSISGLARPLIGFAAGWGSVLAIRVIDRVGKGLRTSPRDAMISDVTHDGIRGAAYGFHRAMDHAGAVVGPLIAAALLHWAGMPMRTVFLLAFVPAVLVVLVLIFAVKDSGGEHKASEGEVFSFRHWSQFSPAFRWMLAALFIFTLGNAADAFLLLRLAEAGVKPEYVAILWSAHHVIKMAANYFLGPLADRIGRRRSILAGWILYAAVYLAMGFVDQRELLVVIFLIYGIYFGLTEPAERALVADLVPERIRGTAFGIFHSVVGFAALPASAVFGVIWSWQGHKAAFTFGAALAGAACLVMVKVTRSSKANGGAHGAA